MDAKNAYVHGKMPSLKSPAAGLPCPEHSGSFAELFYRPAAAGFHLPFFLVTGFRFHGSIRLHDAPAEQSRSAEA
ncbi:hypothetical protein [Stutzerimonas stutzeri]|uniref:Uncharacterized protein n=1 Tax=Stutzerimonas stutzeri TaxID=316 RepID=A0A6I6LTB9_STUST|nr:hypothetical protein [Stutzerimonas stutzeri]QGZ32533.1 hypothetical protein GQA94_21695 [Stutzerimonas stutzeri]